MTSPEAPAVPAPVDQEPTTPSSVRHDLAGRPVADHVAVYEAEHARLQRRLSTIDQL